MVQSVNSNRPPQMGVTKQLQARKNRRATNTQPPNANAGVAQSTVAEQNRKTMEAEAKLRNLNAKRLAQSANPAVRTTSTIAPKNVPQPPANTTIGPGVFQHNKVIPTPPPKIEPPVTVVKPDGTIVVTPPKNDAGQGVSLSLPVLGGAGTKFELLLSSWAKVTVGADGTVTGTGTRNLSPTSDVSVTASNTPTTLSTPGVTKYSVATKLRLSDQLTFTGRIPLYQTPGSPFIATANFGNDFGRGTSVAWNNSWTDGVYASNISLNMKTVPGKANSDSIKLSVAYSADRLLTPAATFTTPSGFSLSATGGLDPNFAAVVPLNMWGVPVGVGLKYNLLGNKVDAQFGTAFFF
jgi:hypothetical protein